MFLKQLDSSNRAESGVIHPVVRLAESSKIVGRAICRVVIQVGYRQTGRDLQTADGAASERIVLIQYTPRDALVAGKRRDCRDHIRHWSKPSVPEEPDDNVLLGYLDVLHAVAADLNL